MITKQPTKKQTEVKVFSLTSPTIASIAGRILAGSLDVSAREVVVLAASALAQTKIPASTLKKSVSVNAKGR